MEETIRNNIDSIDNRIVIEYSFLTKKFDILQLINSFTIQDIEFIVTYICSGSIGDAYKSEVLPSYKYIYNLNLDNLYECYKFVIELYPIDNILIFFEAVNKKNYFSDLSFFEYNIWIKEIRVNVYNSKYIVNTINLFEYVEMFYEQNSIDFFNHMLDYGMFSIDAVTENVVWKYFEHINNTRNLREILYNLIDRKIQICDYISFEKMNNIFNTHKNLRSPKICKYLCEQYDTAIFCLLDDDTNNNFQTSPEPRFILPQFSIASACLEFNTRHGSINDINSITENMWNIYYNMAINNSKFGFSDTFVIYSLIQYIFYNNFPEYNILYVPPNIDYDIIDPNILSEICTDITEYSDILKYQLNVGTALRFSNAYEKYGYRFLEILKYLYLGFSIFDINIDDHLIITIYNITKRNDILKKILEYYKNSIIL